MEYFRTQYEKCYEGEDYYWGLEPASFLAELIETTGKKPTELKVLDIGCGEGKDAVYMAERGCEVTAFDIKPFLELPSDWDKEEKMWETGDLFAHFSNWEICKMNEIIFEVSLNSYRINEQITIYTTSHH